MVLESRNRRDLLRHFFGIKIIEQIIQPHERSMPHTRQPFFDGLNQAIIGFREWKIHCVQLFDETFKDHNFSGGLRIRSRKISLTSDDFQPIEPHHFSTDHSPRRPVPTRVQVGILAEMRSKFDDLCGLDDSVGSSVVPGCFNHFGRNNPFPLPLESLPGGFAFFGFVLGFLALKQRGTRKNTHLPTGSGGKQVPLFSSGRPA